MRPPLWSVVLGMFLLGALAFEPPRAVAHGWPQPPIGGYYCPPGYTGASYNPAYYPSVYSGYPTAIYYNYSPSFYSSAYNPTYGFLTSPYTTYPGYRSFSYSAGPATFYGR
jgi:hypothetical protein